MLVVKKLIRGKVRTNVENLEGFTALDMALGLQWDVNNWEVRELLIHARASQASSLHNTCSLAAFLSSPERFYETKLKDIFYCQQKKELSMGLRNVALVVAVLITITTYQAVLSPPGGVWQGQVNNNNNPLATTNGSFSTNANATTSITALQVNQFSSNATAGQVVMDTAYFTAFFLLNTMALTFSVVVIIIALQWHPYSSLLYVSVAYLVFSYGFSLLIISPDTLVATIFMMVSWFIYLLVFWAKMSFLKLEMELNSNVYGKRPLWMTRLQMLRSLFGGENIP